MTTGFFRSQTEMIENRAAPASTVGVLGWVRTNLLSSWLNAGLTIFGLYVIWLIVPPLITWAFFDATFEGTDRFACENPGACWVFLDQRIGQFLYGFYPAEQTWRVNIALVLLIPALAPLLFENVPFARYLRWFSLAYPVVATLLLVGGFGLEEIPTNKFGGFMLNITVGLSGIVLSLPFGIAQAAMRAIILPQALKYSIPGIVNTFIALFKDTTLVIVIGLFDILNIGRSMVANPDWIGLGIETYAIIALAFFTVCFSISRYSLGLERRLDTSR